VLRYNDFLPLDAERSLLMMLCPAAPGSADDPPPTAVTGVSM